jgi:flagellar basal body-associated protein FliL
MNDSDGLAGDSEDCSMAKRTEKEYFVAFTVIAVSVLLVAGFYFTWMSTKERPPVAYAKYDSIVISNQTYTIKTNISIQTAGRNERWLEKNRTRLEGVIKTSLAQTDPNVALSPNGLQTLQDSLKIAANSAFKTNAIQNVFFTDFVLVMNDSQ